MAEYIDDYENNPGVDADALRELWIFQDNDGDLYRMQKTSIQKNLVTKYARGQYDSKKAAKLWQYFADNAARKYDFEMGHKQPGARIWQQQTKLSDSIFNKQTRVALAKALRDEFENENSAGNYDNYLPKKYQKKKAIGSKRSLYACHGIGGFDNVIG